MENKEIAGELLANLKTKYRCLNQVYDLTSEIERTLESGDGTSLQMVVEMRGKQLEICGDMDSRNEMLLNKLTEAERVHVNTLLRTQEKVPVPEGQDEEDIYAMTKRIRNLLIKTVNYDKKINSRLKK